MTPICQTILNEEGEDEGEISSADDSEGSMNDDFRDFWDAPKDRMSLIKLKFDRCQNPRTKLTPILSDSERSHEDNLKPYYLPNNMNYAKENEFFTDSMDTDVEQVDTTEMDSVSSENSNFQSKLDLVEDVTDDFDILGAKLVSMLLKFTSRSSCQDIKPDESENETATMQHQHHQQQQLTLLESLPSRKSFIGNIRQTNIHQNTGERSGNSDDDVVMYSNANDTAMERESKSQTISETSMNVQSHLPMKNTCISGCANALNEVTCMEDDDATVPQRRIKDVSNESITLNGDAGNTQEVNRFQNHTFENHIVGPSPRKRWRAQNAPRIHAATHESRESTIPYIPSANTVINTASRKRSYSLLETSFEHNNSVDLRNEEAYRGNETVYSPINRYKPDHMQILAPYRRGHQNKRYNDWMFTKSTARTESTCLQVFNRTTDLHLRCNEYLYSPGIDTHTPSSSPLLPSAYPMGRWHPDMAFMSNGTKGLGLSFNWTSLDASTGSLFSPKPKDVAFPQSNAISNNDHARCLSPLSPRESFTPSAHCQWSTKLITPDNMTSPENDFVDSPSSKSFLADVTICDYRVTHQKKSTTVNRYVPSDPISSGQHDLMTEILRSSEDASTRLSQTQAHSLSCVSPDVSLHEGQSVSSSHIRPKRITRAFPPLSIDPKYPGWTRKSPTGKGEDALAIASRKSGLPPCRICGDKASGLHFGVNSCEACNEFYRRTLKRNSQYACAKGGQCDVVGRKRSSCSFCRFQKCLSTGMSRSAIKTGRYSHQKRAMYTLEIKGMERQRADSENQKRMTDMTNDLLMKYRHFFMTSFTLLNTASSGDDGKPADVVSFLSLDDVMTERYMNEEATSTEEWIRQLIKFVKSVEIFEDITLTDQAALIRMSWFEIRFLDSFQHFSFEYKIASDPNRRFISFDQLATLHSHDLASAIFRVAGRLNTLDVTDEELVLMKCLYLTLSDRYNLADRVKVASLTDFLTNSLLYALNKNHHGNGKRVFSRIVDCFVELRSLAWDYFEGFSNFYVHHVTKNSQLLAEMIPMRENM